jgi:hypothetical protein
MTNKSIIAGVWNAATGEFIHEALYHGITREKAIINIIKQFFNKDYCTWNYPDNIEGIHKSQVIKDRLLYDYTDNIIIYAQYN